MASGLVDDIETAARFGGEGTGVTRLAVTDELRAVYDWLSGRLEELGLDVEVDAAGS